MTVVKIRWHDRIRQRKNGHGHAHGHERAITYPSRRNKKARRSGLFVVRLKLTELNCSAEADQVAVVACATIACAVIIVMIQFKT